MSGTRPAVRHSEDVERDPVDAGKDTVRQVLIGPDEGPNFALRRFIMQPGGGMPPHTNTVEHEQYVLRGRARIGIGDDVHDVRAGDVLFIPAGTPHWYEAGEGEPFEFLCVVPNKPDTIELIGDKGAA
ncbi:MAG TPA: cupin domain-containing protein [Gemmatimonadota bacterium]|nr:cupin domain-containing protein [Gemmatimonadota bacterium]